MQNVVTPDQNIADFAFALGANRRELFGIAKMDVHPFVESDENAGVLHAPLQANDDRLVEQRIEERAWKIVFC